MPFKVGVTTGLYYVAHDVGMARTVKKIGYALTRGANVIEIAGDTPHEMSYTKGKELRDIAKNQGLDFLFHGSLTVPMCMPERTDWRDAQDHIEKSVRSAVNSGCKYVLFHACLHFWVELLTYTGTKLTITMCDHKGDFIADVLKEDKKLREWFVHYMRKLGEIQYPQQLILDEEEALDAAHRAHGLYRGWSDTKMDELFKKKQEELGVEKLAAAVQKNPTKENVAKFKRAQEQLTKERQKIVSWVGEEAGKQEAIMARKYMDKTAEKKLKEGGKWKVMTYGRLLDAYRIVAHYLFFTKDPQWMSMSKIYSHVLDKYKIDYNDLHWLMNTWEKAEAKNDLQFKQFIYAVIGAKYLEGHIEALLKWMNTEYIPIELKGKPDLQEIARNLKVTIEIPDARDPKYAGRYMLCHPKQIYSAVSTIRKVLKTDRVWMTMDSEHLATQGFDPIVEMKKLVDLIPNYGELVISVHCTTPTPLHSHYPVELGDTEVYDILWNLRRAGMGKRRNVFLIFERGGGDDPYRQSVDALRIMAKFLEKDTSPKDLPLEFFGLKDTAFDTRRQIEIMRNHRMDVLKDLFEVPEEEWGIFSSSAVRKGKTEAFRKEEVR